MPEPEVYEGAYRRVVRVGDFAHKSPRFTKEENEELYEAARRCNLWELETWINWRPKFGWTCLCPVWVHPENPDVVVMPWASEPATREEVDAAMDAVHPPPHVEKKLQDWRRWNGQIVTVDYGLAHPAEIELYRWQYADAQPF
jgi:hypothetical protein